jgi:hypothetical protein
MWAKCAKMRLEFEITTCDMGGRVLAALYFYGHWKKYVKISLFIEKISFRVDKHMSRETM